jgi:hypothetical protein
MQGSKIRLSPAEAALFCDAQVILTKNTIIQKTIQLLEEVQQNLLQEMPSIFKAASPSPKISKGENYLSLPYVILDYPRIAKDNNLFFIRSMFWWGNFYSSTLQISGKYQTAYLDQLSNAYEQLTAQNYFVGINKDPWVHHFKADNYQSIGALSKNAFRVVLEESSHIKIAAHWPLHQWEEAANNLVRSGKALAGLVA